MLILDQPTSNINQVLDLANDKIVDILVELGVHEEDITNHGDRISCWCPIHHGDNPTAFSFCLGRMKWICFTHDCNDGSGNVIDLVRLALNISASEAISWLISFLNISHDTNYIPKPKIEKPEKPLIKIPLSEVTDRFEPSKFFLDKGFTREILTKYMVSTCMTPGKRMYKRAYTPILDETGKYVVGSTGRTILPECLYCAEYHVQGRGCPVDDHSIRSYPKWIHYGPVKRMMYNECYAKSHIQDSKTVILTEGVKEVWFLEQNNIHNSCCLLGLRVYPYHIKRFEEMGVKNIVFGLDKDEAALNCLEKQKKKLSNKFDIYDLNHILQFGEDIDDLSQDKVNKELKPFLEEIHAK